MARVNPSGQVTAAAVVASFVVVLAAVVGSVDVVVSVVEVSNVFEFTQAVRFVVMLLTSNCNAGASFSSYSSILQNSDLASKFLLVTMATHLLLAEQWVAHWCPIETGNIFLDVYATVKSTFNAQYWLQFSSTTDFTPIVRTYRVPRNNKDVVLKKLFMIMNILSNVLWSAE